MVRASSRRAQELIRFRRGARARNEGKMMLVCMFQLDILTIQARYGLCLIARGRERGEERKGKRKDPRTRPRGKYFFVSAASRSPTRPSARHSVPVIGLGTAWVGGIQKSFLHSRHCPMPSSVTRENLEGQVQRESWQGPGRQRRSAAGPRHIRQASF